MQMLLREPLICAIALAGVAVVAAPARADDRVDDAKRTVESADIDYKLGRFSTALDKYTRAYELYPVAPLLFNIGQCHKNLKQFAKAIFFYEGYLRDAPKASNRALVEDLIREARRELIKSPPPPAGTPAQEPAPPEPAPAPTPGPAQAPSPVTAQATPAALPVTSPSSPSLSGDLRLEAPPERDRVPAGRSRVVPVLLFGTGTAAIAGGAVLYYYGQKRGPNEMYIYDDTRLLGGAVMALGGAALVTGAILWFRGPAAPVPVAAITPGGGYIAWVGQF